MCRLVVLVLAVAVGSVRGESLARVATIEREDIQINPDIENLSFDGVAEIRGTIDAPAYGIELHSKNLDIRFAEIELDGVDVTDEAGIIGKEDEDKLIVIFKEKTKIGQTFYLHFRYQGKINTKPEGLYLFEYQDKDGVTKKGLTTQLGLTYARQVFPCFDDPGYRIRYSIAVARDQAFDTISNTEKESVTQEENLFWDIFERTAPMPSYLLAFTISDFGKDDQSPYSIYGREELINDDKFAYALTKIKSASVSIADVIGAKPLHVPQQSVAIPDAYFKYNGMENWGHVSYKEKNLVYSEATSTTSEKMTVATTIAHEVVHQLFGNLVTPKWWDMAWLSEGFATYYSYNLLYNSDILWKPFDLLVVKSTLPALFEDSLSETTPVVHNVVTTEDIENHFNTITYNKGAALVKMLKSVLPAEVFRNSIIKYLEENELRSVDQDALISALQSEIDTTSTSIEVPIADFMTQWTTQPGYPVLTVIKSADSIQVKQDFFSLDDVSSEVIWPIPFKISVCTEPCQGLEDIKGQFWLTEKEIPIPEVVGQFVLLDKRIDGFYRINYDENNWKKITEFLKGTFQARISSMSRARLIDDAFNLARAGRLSYALVLDFIGYIEFERDYIPLYSFLQSLTYVNDMLARTDIYRTFKQHIIKLLKPVYEELTTDVIDGEVDLDRLNRIQILNWMCKMGDLDCQRKMKEVLNKKEKIHPDLQEPVYCGGMHSGAEEEWYYLNNLYRDDDIDVYQKERIIQGMSCIMNTDYLKILLTKSLSTSNAQIFKSVYMGTDLGLELAFDFLLENFIEFTEVFSTRQVGEFFKELARKLAQESDLEKFENFVAGLDPRISTQYMDIFNVARKNFRRNILWAEKYLDDITSWFEKNTM